VSTLKAPSTQNSGNPFLLARSNHTNGVNACMADASVRFISNSINANTWNYLGTMAAGEVVPNF
jgi:prepilin-type processing-associated H-X9-DG protein